MRCVIIEDEIAAVNLLSKIINDYCAGMSVVGHAANVESGVSLIEETNPDLIFLDIRLGDEISFNILDRLKARDFYIIITTAYDEYAISAFKYGAIDYILKPYVPKNVLESVERVKKREQSQEVFKKLNALISEKGKEDRIALTTSDGIRFCAANEIIRIEAAASYCVVYLLDNEKILLSKSLAEMEKSLPEDQFYRVHSSHTVNTKYVKNIKNEDGGYIEMMNGAIVPIARRRKQNFLNQIN